MYGKKSLPGIGTIHQEEDFFLSQLLLLQARTNSSNTNNEAKDKIAWKVTGKWDAQNIQKFRDFAGYMANKNTNDKYTCEDYALSLLIFYAKANGLPLILKNETGTYKPDDNYDCGVGGCTSGGFREFFTTVLASTGAPDVQAMSSEVDKKKVQIGDMPMELTKDGVAKHIQVITNLTTDVIYINQGNTNRSSWFLRPFDDSEPFSDNYIGVKVQSGHYVRSSGNYFNTTRSAKKGLWHSKLLKVYFWNLLNFNYKKSN